LIAILEASKLRGFNKVKKSPARNGWAFCIHAEA